MIEYVSVADDLPNLCNTTTTSSVLCL